MSFQELLRGTILQNQSIACCHMGLNSLKQLGEQYNLKSDKSAETVFVQAKHPSR